MKRAVILFVAIGVAGLAIFLSYRYLIINTKDSVVNHHEYLGNKSNPAGIYDRASLGMLYSPLNIAVVPMDKLMLVDIEDDPEYTTIELQTFDDTRGRGARVLLYHHTGPADSYYTDEAFIQKESEHDKPFIAPDMQYRFDVTASGLDSYLKIRDHKGKNVEFRVKEAPRRKWAKGFPAPIGGSDAITFDYFPFFHMKGMNFVPRSGTDITINIGEVERKPKKIPIPVNWEFVYFCRFTAAPIIGCWNKPHDGELRPLQPERHLVIRDGQTRYELDDNAGHYEIRRMLGFSDKHEVCFDFSPPIPDIPGLKDGTQLTGRFSTGADGILGILAGVYHISRRGNIIDMEIHPRECWQPMPGTLWVKNWVWKGNITVGTDHTVSMKSKWIREN